MARRSFIQIDGKLYERGVDQLPERHEARGNLGIIPDCGDFVSPIDGKVYSGRAGLRDHCARHDVVPTADLAGLPLRTMNQQYAPDTAAIRSELKRQMYK